MTSRRRGSPVEPGHTDAVTDGPATPTPVDIAFTFSFDSWAVSSARGNFSSDVLSQDLLRGDRARKLLVADPYRSALGAVKRRLTGRTDNPFPVSDRATHFAPRRLRRDDPTDPAAVRALYGRYLRRLEAAARTRGLEDPVLLTTHPFIAGAAKAGYWKHVTYYGWDDWAAHPTYAAYQQAVLDAYASIAAEGHRVIGVTRRIVDRIGSPGRSVVVPNGLREDEWAEPVAPPAWFLDYKAPRLLYSGSVDSRIDLAYVNAVSDAFPDASIVIVGQVQDAAAVEPLRTLPNVHFMPIQTREIIRGVTFAADVALIPHVKSDLTQAMSPLKMYEYVAAGRPVVATDLEPVRTLPQVRRVATPQEFVAEVRSALAGGGPSEEERLAFLAANSWRARLEQLYDAAL
ncbi:MAG: hypothetical protein JWM93_3875 [Frankiales bacterium]|nr:hypothetical protein [Frankiales bacterium]